MSPHKRLKEFLKDHDIALEVEGCGCCGSPGFKLVYKGEIIVDEPENFNFDSDKDYE